VRALPRCVAWLKPPQQSESGPHFDAWRIALKDSPMITAVIMSELRLEGLLARFDGRKERAVGEATAR
jgi:hypothetical protein